MRTFDMSAQVLTKNGDWFSTFEDVPESKRSWVRPSMFPQDNMQDMHIDRWWVVYSYLMYSVVCYLLLPLTRRVAHLLSHYWFPSYLIITICHVYFCSIRIVPHHQNTGGFFVAVLEKTKPLPWQKVEKSQLLQVMYVFTR